MHVALPCHNINEPQDDICCPPAPPLPLTLCVPPQELAESRGVSLDESGFEAAMSAQRARSSSSREAVDLTAAGPGLGQLAGQLAGGTVFEGYGDASLQLPGCSVVGLLLEGQPVQSVSGQGRGGGWG